MESEPGPQEGGHRHRRRRALWKRRRFWIALFAVLTAIALTLWLIQNIGSNKDLD